MATIVKDIIMLLTVAAAVWYGISGRTDVSDLRERADTIRAELSATREALDEAQQRIDDLQTRVEQTESRLAESQRIVEEVQRIGDSDRDIFRVIRDRGPIKN